jgi:hypothetical protein
MVEKNLIIRLALSLALIVTATSASAVTYSNVSIQSPPLSNGSSFLTSENSVSFTTPNAIVGDFQPTRSGTLTIRYDASSAPAMFANDVVVNLFAVPQGSGTVTFTETVFELDTNGDVIGSPIGSASQLFDANSNQIWSTTIVFDRQVQNLRVEKSFSLDATLDTPAFDVARVAVVDQNIQVVPEPATLSALTLGAIGLLACRRRR